MPKNTFYFYDLETTGVSPRHDRVMQFAGQRTDEYLKPMGEPDNILIRLSEDILPAPEAIFITGITPQQTLSEGITEAEFLRYFFDSIAIPDTIFAGFNTVRFDDEFMRHMLYRNFYDAYEWQWADGRGRWDLLDVVRMTRALRPEGIKWPFAPDGKASNRLELLTSVNKLEHNNAHDALSDVNASIAVARMIRNKQPKLFDYLLEMRDKKKVAALAAKGDPFIYTSGKYPAEYEKTAVVAAMAPHPKTQGTLVYDLRYDPTPLDNLTPDEIVKAWRARKEDVPRVPFPVKVLQHNRVPAVAPLSVLDEASQERLKIDLKASMEHLKALKGLKNFSRNVITALGIMDKELQGTLLENPQAVDAKLYDGFIPDGDKLKMSALRVASPEEISKFAGDFADSRLNELLPLYKARNFSRYLNADERTAWEQYRRAKLVGAPGNSPLEKYFEHLQKLSQRPELTKQEGYILEELKLYAESIMPLAEEG